MFVLYADLGFEVVLSDVDQEGINRIEAAFCLPSETKCKEIPVENVTSVEHAFLFRESPII